MDFDYFYEEQSDSYSFYRIPKSLFTEAEFERLSTDAKILYGLLLDRVGLSKKNAWMDEAGRVYVYFTIKNVKQALGCQNTKACALLKELEEFGLIERKRQGLCKPTIIYVKNFVRFRNAEFRASGMQNSGDMENGTLDSRKSESNNTEKNNTDFNNTNLILSSREDERRDYIAYFTDVLEIKWLKQTYPYDGEIIDEMLEIIVDVVCSTQDFIYISGDRKPINVVKSKFMKLNNSHIQYVLDQLKENTTEIRKMKQYLIATLYNAPITISSYYHCLVNHDMATGKI